MKSEAFFEAAVIDPMGGIKKKRGSGMKLSYEKKRNLSGYIFLAPWLFGAAFLLIYPFFYSLSLSFSELADNNLSHAVFAGLKNYKRAFVTDVSFVPIFLTTVTDTLINTPMIVIFSMLTAIFVSRHIKGRGVFRLVFFLPVLLGAGFVMSLLQGHKLQENTMELARGILLPEIIQRYIGPELTGYISTFLTRITMVMWRSGVQIIVMLAGIQSISPSLYEVARVDGAAEWEMFWKITLPMTAPILLLNIVYTIVASFMGSSGMVNYILAQSFSTTVGAVSDFAYAAALGWIYFLFVLVVILLVFLVMRPAVNRVSER